MQKESILSPLLFFMYTTNTRTVLVGCGALSQLYGDYIQAYLHYPVSAVEALTKVATLQATLALEIIGIIGCCWSVVCISTFPPGNLSNG